MSSADAAFYDFPSTGVFSRHAQRRIFVLLLGLCDVMTIGVAFAVAYWLRFNLGLGIADNAAPAYEFYQRLGIFIAIPWLCLFYLYKLYNSHQLFGGLDEYVRVVQANTFGMMLFIGATFFFQSFLVSRGWIVFAWFATCLFVCTERFMMRRLAYALRRRGYLLTTTLIVGADEEGRAIAHQLRTTPKCGADVIGFLDDHVSDVVQVDGLPVLGSVAAIQQVVARRGVEEVLISLGALTRAQVITIYDTFGTDESLEIRFSPGMFEILTTGAWVREWGSVPLVSINKVRLSDAETVAKNFFDLMLAALAFVLLSPVLIIIALFVSMDSPGPIFHHRRVLGRGGREFDALKFRTMYVNGKDILDSFPELRDEFESNQKLKRDPRVTPIGRVLRKYSLDELPQLFNVLLGQMSLVGPRMITPSERQKYGKMKLNLLTVKPGITGLWQISGRSDLSFEERVRLDMNYIRNYSFWLDVMIILKTIPAVLRGRGAY
jgi:exopolysaccharide biosynthesis polyprenyl glycosylphosphotransferase